MQGGSSSATVSTILTNVTSVVTESVTWITTFVGAITSNPLILTFVILGIAGMGVGLVRRLMRL